MTRVTVGATHRLTLPSVYPLSRCLNVKGLNDARGALMEKVAHADGAARHHKRGGGIAEVPDGMGASMSQASGHSIPTVQQEHMVFHYRKAPSQAWRWHARPATRQRSGPSRQ
jgi:hypothetical protein